MIQLIGTRKKDYFDMCRETLRFPPNETFLLFHQTIRLLPQRRVDQIHWNFACCSIVLRGNSKKKYKFSPTLFSKWYETTCWVQYFLETLEIMPRWSYFFNSFKGTYNSNDKWIPYLIWTSNCLDFDSDCQNVAVLPRHKTNRFPTLYSCIVFPF